jgi:hypothetical protein
VKRPHILSTDEVESYTFTHRIAGSHGERENKSLDAEVTCGTGGVTFVVNSHRKEVHRGASLTEAVHAYNRV